MPDPDVHRNRALDRIAGAIEQNNKKLEVMNKNLVDIGRAVVPAFQALAVFLDGIDRETLTVSTGTAASLDEDYTRVVTDEMPEPKKTRFVMIPISESSAQTLRSCGYDPGFESGTFFVALPILKEDPNGST